MALTDTAIRNAKAGLKLRKLSDGGGLQLHVMPSGAKIWRYAYRLDGKQKTLVLGPYPGLSLGDARRRHFEAREQLQAGIDPASARRAAKLATEAARRNTFDTAADDLIDKKTREGRGERTMEKVRWLLSIARPVLGSRPITEISAGEVLAILRPVERAGKLETARRLRSLIGEVFRLAIAQDQAQNDPTLALRGALVTPTVKHHAAITDPKRLGELLRAIDGFTGQVQTKAALQLAALLALRPGELRNARWQDVDLVAKVWTIPAANAKQRREHRTPLFFPDPGQTEPTRKKKDEARNDLAKEICAFANGYGGMIIVAVDDNESVASDLSPVPDAAATARRLEDALLSIIDPPIGGLELGAVLRPDGDGQGAIVIRVPASLSAPHGFGFPPAAYVRRGEKSMPTTMRDLQSMFWDARMRRERVSEIRNDERARLDEIRGRYEKGSLQSEMRKHLEKLPGAFARISAIAHSPMPIRSLGIERLRQVRPELNSDNAPAFGQGLFRDMSLVAGGVEASDEAPSQWRLHNDGVVSVIGFHPVQGFRDHEGIYPGWLAASAMTVICTMETVRRNLRQPGLPYEVDAEIWNTPGVMPLPATGYRSWDLPQAHPISRIGPFTVGAASDVEPVFRAIEEGIWNAYALDVQKQIAIPDLLGVRLA